MRSKIEKLEHEVCRITSINEEIDNKYKWVVHLLWILILTLIIFIRITLNQLEKQSETIVQLRNEKLETEKKLTISKHDYKEVRISWFWYNIYFDTII